MAFRAGLKNSGKWQRVNTLLKKHSNLKGAINGDAEVKRILGQMDTVLRSIASDLSVTNSAMGELAAHGFPVPYVLWSGHLPALGTSGGTFDVSTEQTQMYSLASQLRNRVDTMIRGYKLIGDAYDLSPEQFINPGGSPGAQNTGS
jgi:hypothetical protein